MEAMSQSFVKDPHQAYNEAIPALRNGATISPVSLTLDKDANYRNVNAPQNLGSRWGSANRDFSMSLKERLEALRKAKSLVEKASSSSNAISHALPLKKKGPQVQRKSSQNGNSATELATSLIHVENAVNKYCPAPTQAQAAKKNGKKSKKTLPDKRPLTVDENSSDEEMLERDKNRIWAEKVPKKTVSTNDPLLFEDQPAPLPANDPKMTGSKMGSSSFGFSSVSLSQSNNEAVIRKRKVDHREQRHRGLSQSSILTDKQDSSSDGRSKNRIYSSHRRSSFREREALHRNGAAQEHRKGNNAISSGIDEYEQIDDSSDETSFALSKTKKKSSSRKLDNRSSTELLKKKVLHDKVASTLSAKSTKLSAGKVNVNKLTKKSGKKKRAVDISPENSSRESNRSFSPNKKATQRRQNLQENGLTSSNKSQVKGRSLEITYAKNKATRLKQRKNDALLATSGRVENSSRASSQHTFTEDEANYDGYFNSHSPRLTAAVANNGDTQKLSSAQIIGHTGKNGKKGVRQPAVENLSFIPGNLKSKASRHSRAPNNRRKASRSSEESALSLEGEEMQDAVSNKKVSKQVEPDFLPDKIFFNEADLARIAEGSASNITPGVTCASIYTDKVNYAGALGLVEMTPKTQYGPVKNDRGFLSFLITNCESEKLKFDSGVREGNPVKCKTGMQLIIAPNDIYGFKNESPKSSCRILVVCCKAFNNGFDPSDHIDSIDQTNFEDFEVQSLLSDERASRGVNLSLTDAQDFHALPYRNIKQLSIVPRISGGTLSRNNRDELTDTVMPTKRSISSKEARSRHNGVRKRKKRKRLYT
ncbi:hypothetical protein IE077_000453 [Cardiosporidium cionae]|uniref:Uncharacterized protein n=1 Tax=Cardiosporidium cionae TaxID=476202 RepID=A0ABQ7J997_9APIC|nr:hypothetical protein IE077_000453 [Cardiosporidium cionae]|eukprot:KAF8820573.1 hypothetical protein IE077_000453 [Cardiosporidium cionae]